METNEQMEVMDEGFDAFEEAFLGTDGNHTECEENTEDIAEETSAEATEPEEEDSEGDEKAGAEALEEEKPPQEAETFTLRVNKEDKVVSREEVVSLAQKGYDYDRVKGQLTEARTENQQLQERIGKNAEIMETLEMVSKDTGIPIDALVEQLHVNFRVKKGESEAEARANIRALKAETQIAAMKEKASKQAAPAEDSMARAEREVAEFKKRFPGVELTEALCKQLSKDVNAGNSISDAYQKMLNEQKDAEIAELKRQIEAEKQNEKNNLKSVGSQKDSGGKRGKSAEDEFFAAFER
jgi:hypothetical protein